MTDLPTTHRIQVHLKHLVSNYRLLQSLAPRSTVAAVVKANAYGLGAGPVSVALATAGCEDFFVASLAEGVWLREYLRSSSPTFAPARIYVLEGVDDDLKAGLLYQLTPVLNTWESFARWREKAPDQEWVFQLDTGIGRAGFCESEWMSEPLTLAKIREHSKVMLLSQLACSDEPQHPMNPWQLARFKRMHACVPQARRSLANSAGILLGADFQADVVRPGLGLYGGQPSHTRIDGLKPVVQVDARVLQVKTFSEAHPIGYGSTIVVPAGSQIATLGFGYADGYPRECAQAGQVLFKGVACPIVGRLSMDLMTVHIPHHIAQDSNAAPVVGDWMTLLGTSHGAEITLEDIATRSQRSAYTILTSLNALLKRDYI